MATLSETNKETIRELLTLKEKTRRSFYPLFLNDDNGVGWKVSIQGKSQEDTVLIFDVILDFLLENNINAKFALSKCHYARDKIVEDEAERIHRKIQSHKVVTVYCPNHFDIMDLCANLDRDLLCANYNGWEGVDSPLDYKKYSNRIYYRNDMDENGSYIPTNNNVEKRIDNERHE